MNKYIKQFLHRGMIFGGLGPIVAGIVFVAVEANVEDFSLGGVEVLVAIVSTYLLAFVQAGASVFNRIEHWPIAKSLLAHFLSIYAAYVGTYLVNFWIPFEPTVIAIFTAVFAVVYFIIWLSVFFAVKATGKRLNEKVK